MFGILADDHHFAVTLDHLALLAHFLHGRFDFHDDASIFSGAGSLRSERDPSLCQIIHGNLDGDAVTGKNPDIVQSHFSRDVTGYDVTVGQLDAEDRVRQNLDHRTFALDNIFLAQNNSSSPRAAGSPFRNRFSHFRT